MKKHRLISRHSHKFVSKNWKEWVENYQIMSVYQDWYYDIYKVTVHEVLDKYLNETHE
jgi:hypothetical protein